MPAQKPLSISVGDFTTQLKTAVPAALGENQTFRELRADIRFVSHPGIIGFTIRDPQLSNRPVSELSKLAGDVTAQLPQLAERYQPGFLIRDGGILVGFFPVADVLELRE